MSIKAFAFDGVSFWDMAGERHLELDRKHDIRDIGLVPLPGDRVSFPKENQQFTVVYREFAFRNGACSVMVNLQPAVRGR